MDHLQFTAIMDGKASAQNARDSKTIEREIERAKQEIQKLERELQDAKRTEAELAKHDYGTQRQLKRQGFGVL